MSQPTYSLQYTPWGLSITPRHSLSPALRDKLAKLETDGDILGLLRLLESLNNGEL
jgi:hypothetical protein